MTMETHHHDNQTPTDAHTPGHGPPPIPKPVFFRLLLLFGGGICCLFIGVIMAWVMRDTTTLGMSVIICAALVIAGVSLKRKISRGEIYSLSGVCIGSTPKMFGRYKRTTFVILESGEEVSIVLPKKTEYKIGHSYITYFSAPIKRSHQTDKKTPQGGFFVADMDFPTNGYIGREDLGIYTEKPTQPVSDETAVCEAGEKEGAETNNHVYTARQAG